MKQRTANTQLPKYVLIGQPQVSVLLELSPHFKSKVSLKVKAFILPRAFSYRLPSKSLTSLSSIFESLRLADPQFMLDDRIDMILGATAAIHAKIVSGTVERGKAHEPIATKSKLGWLLSGPIGLSTSTLVAQDCTKEPNPQEQKCEDHYLKMTRGDESGRFLVGLPFKVNLSVLKIHALPIRTLPEPCFSTWKENSKFVPAFGDGYWLLPHHDIIQESNTTTKMRVVFNGSARSKNSVSINDILDTGPNLLPPLFDLMLRWQNY
ncbi:uncharacterized protein LOC106640500 [Copidosoma floridanum]|uniref:uncharacterized protein LOC106640499 n=1 Tax=Copidosoma floridanum TaxID=29053 RepID=UPI0006C93E13|nr:uncharacterized protein LOC106640499 [Copidosoma floridanum]XP_014210056.1 uncharacterized protein LOC106640500 [Copidosoma floridanum]